MQQRVRQEWSALLAVVLVRHRLRPWLRLRPRHESGIFRGRRKRRCGPSPNRCWTKPGNQLTPIQFRHTQTFCDALKRIRRSVFALTKAQQSWQKRSDRRRWEWLCDRDPCTSGIAGYGFRRRLLHKGLHSRKRRDEARMWEGYLDPDWLRAANTNKTTPDQDVAPKQPGELGQMLQRWETRARSRRTGTAGSR